MESAQRQAFRVAVISNDLRLRHLARMLAYAGNEVDVRGCVDPFPAGRDAYVVGRAPDHDATPYLDEENLRQMEPGAVLFCSGSHRTLREIAARYGIVVEEPNENQSRQMLSDVYIQGTRGAIFGYDLSGRLMADYFKRCGYDLCIVEDDPALRDRAKADGHRACERSQGTACLGFASDGGEPGSNGSIGLFGDLSTYVRFVIERITQWARWRELVWDWKVLCEPDKIILDSCQNPDRRNDDERKTYSNIGSNGLSWGQSAGNTTGAELPGSIAAAACHSSFSGNEHPCDGRRD